MKMVVMGVITGLCICLSSMAWPYDKQIAESYARLFQDVDGEGAGKALNFLSVERFTDGLKLGEQYVAIDVRTTAESRLFRLSTPDNLAIPVNQLFTPEKLALIPTDKPVVIICKSGARATAAGTALRHIGFDNVYILKGGFQGLAGYYGPQQAYSQPAQPGK